MTKPFISETHMHVRANHPRRCPFVHPHSKDAGWPSGLAHVSSTTFESSTGRIAMSATGECWSKGRASGRR